MSTVKDKYNPLEGHCSNCARGLIWVTPDGTEIKLCHRDAKLAKVKKAGWVLK